MNISRFSRWVATNFLAALLLCGAPAIAALGVSPALVEMTLEKGKASGSFLVTNTGDSQIRVRATRIHFRLSRAGQLSRIPVDSTSLVQWLKVNPGEFVLPAGGKRQIRYAIVMPDSLPDGSYWGALEFAPLPSARDSLRARSEVVPIAAAVVPLMIEKGRPQYGWRLNPDSMSYREAPEGIHVQSILENTGDGRIPYTGRYELRDRAGAVIDSGSTPRLSLFPRSVRISQVVIKKQLAPGEYAFDVTYTSEADNSTVAGTLPVIVTGVPEKRVGAVKR